MENINLKKFDSSQVTKMYYTFYNCTNLKELDLSSFHTDKCTDFTNIFAYISKLTIIVDPRYAINIIEKFGKTYNIINVTNF